MSPLPKDIGNIVRMTLLAPKFWDLDAKSVFFLCILLFLLLNLFEMLFALFAGSLVRVGSLRLFWGMIERGVRVETFVRVLPSSRVNLNKCK